MAHQSYHKAPYYTAAAAAAKSNTFAQYSIAKSIYRMRALESVIAQRPQKSDLLRQSALYIRKWNATIPVTEREILQKMNQVPLVQMWTGDEPKYVLRSLTDAATRLTHELYYTQDFEWLLDAT